MLTYQSEHLKAINDNTEHVRSHVTTIQQNQDVARHSEILEWFSPTNYPTQQSDIMSRRQQGTGQWFLDAPEFARWLGVPKGTLFCPGIPGAGKTVVAAIAIDYLLKSAQSSSVGVAYVYCNYKAHEEQGASSMLAALIKQLVRARPSIMESVEQLHKQHIDRGTKPSLEEILGALRRVIMQYTTVYVVVDALDECGNSDGTRHQFLTKLQELQATQDVRLLTTSRFIPEIEDAFKEAVRLEVRADNNDVRRFVAGQMYRLPKCIQRDPVLQEMVVDKIVQAVDGM
jgi:Cdc6-like AAA superfamily ATPase